MDRIRQSIRKFTESSAFPFFVLFLLMLLVHATIFPDFADDQNNRQLVMELGVLDYALQLYQTWSSRIIIETTYLSLLVHSAWIWRLLDCGIMVLLAYSISKIFVSNNKRRYNWYIVGIVLLYPWMHMMTAGWIGTTANYSWSLALGLYALCPLRSILVKEKLPWYHFILPTLAIIYAANEEQMAALLLGILTLSLAYMAFVQRRTHIYVLLQLFITVGMLIFIFSSPGNDVRMEKEIISNYPDFLMYNPFERLCNVFLLIGNSFIAKPNLPFTVVCILAALSVWLRYQEPLYRVIASVPLAGSLLLGGLSSVLSVFFPSTTLITSLSATVSNFYQKSVYIPFILYVIIFGCLLMAFFLAFADHNKAVISILLLCAGLASKMIMAFSPTMYVSGVRTDIYLYFALLIIALLLIRSLYEERNWRYIRCVSGGVATLAACSYLNFWLSV